MSGEWIFIIVLAVGVALWGALWLLARGERADQEHLSNWDADNDEF